MVSANKTIERYSMAICLAAIEIEKLGGNFTATLSKVLDHSEITNIQEYVNRQMYYPLKDSYLINSPNIKRQ